MNGVRDRSEKGWDVGNARASRQERAVSRARRHAEDAALIVGAPSSRWTDALLSEARAQIGGCLNSVELAITLNINVPAVSALVETLGTAYCRHAIEAEPQLLGKGLIEHFRLRAALVLVARNARERAVPPEMDGEARGAMLADEPDPDGLLAALNLAEMRWLTQAPPDAPIRADLPADIYADLIWSAAALLVQACERQLGHLSREIIEAISDATERAAARHDEVTGPFALADRFARIARPDERRRLALLALRERRLLLFAALAARELNVTLVAILAALLDDVPGGRGALLSAMGVDDLSALRTLEALSPLDGHMADDEAITHFIEALRAQTAEQTEAVMARIAGSPPLAERLAMLERATT